MKNAILCICLVIVPVIAHAAGTDTFSSVQIKDAAKNYLNTDNISVTKVYEDSVGVQKERLCLNINDPAGGKDYKITDEKEIILLLFSILTDLNAKLNTK